MTEIRVKKGLITPRTDIYWTALNYRSKVIPERPENTRPATPTQPPKENIMALYLVELTPANPSKEEATALIETVNSSPDQRRGAIETQVSADHKIVFVIIEAENTAFGPDLAAAIR